MPPSPRESALAAEAIFEDRLVSFFDAHYGRMTRLAGLVCHDMAAAEDAVQSAMEQAWRRQGSLRDVNQLRPWLDRIVVREAIRLNRRSSRRRGVHRLSDEHAGRLHDPRTDVGPARLALDAAFALLAAEQRAAIVLHLHLGYTVPETARLMGASVETTRSRLRLARQRLRGELGEDAP
jgi:RNA polymerase sigma-70 factor (ECF subfamily)